MELQHRYQGPSSSLIERHPIPPSSHLLILFDMPRTPAPPRSMSSTATNDPKPNGSSLPSTFTVSESHMIDQHMKYAAEVGMPFDPAVSSTMAKNQWKELTKKQRDAWVAKSQDVFERVVKRYGDNEKAQADDRTIPTYGCDQTPTISILSETLPPSTNISPSSLLLRLRPPLYRLHHVNLDRDPTRDHQGTHPDPV